MMWSEALEIDVIDYNSQIIAINIKDGTCSWSLVGYGPPYQSKRRKAWENLAALLESLDGPWICLGDFNVVLGDNEKEGGRLGSSSTPNYLKDILFELGVVDLVFSGNSFTWTNKRWGRNCIRERLDRGIANISWRLNFPKAAIFHLGAINSDHCPLLLDTWPQAPLFNRPFRFEVAWTRDPRCMDVVENAWREDFRGNEAFKLCMKQQKTRNALKKWNWKVLGHCKVRIKEITNKIEEI